MFGTEFHSKFNVRRSMFFASIAVQIGGIGSIALNRRKDLAQLGIKSLIGGTLACLMTACIAGIFIKLVI